jgi:hypothetical protein
MTTTEKTWRERVAQANLLKEVGLTEFYLIEGDDRPYQHVTNVSGSTMWRSVNVNFTAEIEGLKFSWWIEFDNGETNNRHHMLMSLAPTIMHMLPEPAQRQFKQVFEKARDRFSARVDAARVELDQASSAFDRATAVAFTPIVGRVSNIEAVLKFVNDVRQAFGAAKIDDLPKGMNSSASKCPVASAFYDISPHDHGVLAYRGVTHIEVDAYKHDPFDIARRLREKGYEASANHHTVSVHNPGAVIDFISKFDSRKAYQEYAD